MANSPRQPRGLPPNSRSSITRESGTRRNASTDPSGRTSDPHQSIETARFAHSPLSQSSNSDAPKQSQTPNNDHSSSPRPQTLSSRSDNHRNTLKLSVAKKLPRQNPATFQDNSHRTNKTKTGPNPTEVQPIRSKQPVIQQVISNTSSQLDEPIRLNKRMSELGLCSRREADDWIAKGWVKVNGNIATLGQTVLINDLIQTHQVAQAAQKEKVTILLHKPISYVSGQAEDGYTPAVALVDKDSQWKEDLSPRRFSLQQLLGLAPAGRLDIDSTGLLILTQDGRIARQIIGENSHIEKEYLVRVSMLVKEGPHAGQVIHENVQAYFPHFLLEKLRFGLSLDGQALRRAKVDWINPEQLKIVLTEGKKRQIRRMCELVGLHVVGLKRVRIGRVVLGHLPLGQWRYLSDQETF